jgi:hypothetical protein
MGSMLAELDLSTSLSALTSVQAAITAARAAYSSIILVFETDYSLPKVGRMGVNLSMSNPFVG